MKGFIINFGKNLAVSTAATIGTFGGLMILGKIQEAIENKKSKKSEEPKMEVVK